MKAWVLVGMMGAGKTTVGRKLAELSGREFIDTDQLIVNRLGKSIEKIFEQYGESTFREHEASIISSLLEGSSVVSTGGGAILRAENAENLKRIGTTVYLRVPKDQLIERLESSRRKRPLLKREDWKTVFGQIFDDRQAAYERCDHIVDLNDLTHDQAAAALMEVLHNG